MEQSRWRGQPGRLEVWYTTLTDETSGTGLWIHTELVAPAGGEQAFVHGWAALFPPDAPPLMERFGPRTITADAGQGPPGSNLRGSAGPLSWDLSMDDPGRPLHTFPRYAWERELLPAAQIVPAPTARFRGRVSAGERDLLVDGPGAAARIYGQGNAKRWAWLHADLGGGDVLEIVSAVSRRSGLSLLPPLTFVQLRRDGRDWPRDPLLAAPLFRARIGLPRWFVTGIVGNLRLRVHVRQDPARSVAAPYTDPDGAAATCRNSEVASAGIILERWWGGWRREGHWRLDGTAHAEVGTRP